MAAQGIRQEGGKLAWIPWRLAMSWSCRGDQAMVLPYPGWSRGPALGGDYSIFLVENKENCEHKHFFLFLFVAIVQSFFSGVS
jgi:hypothetical protein